MAKRGRPKLARRSDDGKTIVLSNQAEQVMSHIVDWYKRDAAANRKLLAPWFWDHALSGILGRRFKKSQRQARNWIKNPLFREEFLLRTVVGEVFLPILQHNDAIEEDVRRDDDKIIRSMIDAGDQKGAMEHYTDATTFIPPRRQK
jgi:hypothetical protein